MHCPAVDGAASFSVGLTGGFATGHFLWLVFLLMKLIACNEIESKLCGIIIISSMLLVACDQS